MNGTSSATHLQAENGNELGTATSIRRLRKRSTTLKRGLALLLRRATRPASGTRIDVAFVVLCAVVYGVLFFGLGNEFLPGHAAWATLLLWASALIGSLVAELIRIPNVIGMLAAGIMLRNIPWNAIDAFPDSWGTQMRAAALATIFLRCGLELDFGTMKRYQGPAARLAIIPGLAEAFFDGGLATVIFGMPIMLGFTFGFIIKAVGPGLVVPAMFTLQKKGLGKDQGIPSTLVIAASFDDIIAIIGYSIFVNIAIQGGGNVAWQIAAGPLQVVFGICGGLIAGVALGCTKIFDTKVKRLVGIYGACLLLMFFLGYWDMKAGGAIAALTVGLIASNAWEKGFPSFASLCPSYEYSPAIERYMHMFWVWIMEPIMFVTIGASIDVETLDTGTIPKALIIIFSGLGLRMVATYITMLGYNYSWKELVFYAIAWTPKATVQAALSAAPLTLIQARIPPSDPDYADWITWGNDILTTGIFTIIICGTLGLLAIHFTAPFLLQPCNKQEDGEQEQELEPQVVDRKSSEASVPVKATTDVAAPAGDRSCAGRVTRRPSTPHPAGLPEMSGDDYELVAEYIDAIRHLVVVAQAERPDKEEVQRLSNMVMHIQKRIETEVGRREPSVREMFRTASYLAAQRPISVNRQGQGNGTGSAGTGGMPRGAPASSPGSRVHAMLAAPQGLQTQGEHHVLGLHAAASQPGSPLQPKGSAGEDQV